MYLPASFERVIDPSIPSASDTFRKLAEELLILKAIIKDLKVIDIGDGIITGLQEICELLQSWCILVAYFGHLLSLSLKTCWILKGWQFLSSKVFQAPSQASSVAPKKKPSIESLAGPVTYCLTLIVPVVQICTHRPGMPVVQICTKKT